MAIDSVDKSRSAMGFPWFVIFPIADGEIDQADSPHLMGLYRGNYQETPWTDQKPVSADYGGQNPVGADYGGQNPVSDDWSDISNV